MLWIPIKLFIETVYRRVIPLYSFDQRGRPFLASSAVPFQDNGFFFLITATHCCFQNGKPLPLFVYGENKPHALTECRIAWEYSPGKSPDLDIAVIALDENCAEDLQKRHLFCSPEDVRTTMPRTPGIHYLIAGYPASRNRRRPPALGLPSRATALITGEIGIVDSVNGVDKTPNHHFSIEFPYEKVPAPGGGDFYVPPPYGMSGGGVWRVEIDMRERLVGRPYLVGIGIEYHKKDKTFVATKVQAAAPLAQDLRSFSKRKE
ncbi:MAG: hypothetical protein ABIS50_15385 [Luteolibacter sp.]|uniref:hypothetical protein n=1 Tax=Luteolibacter sp. TaxID=1962973 RepID=UPI003262E65A